MKLKEITRNGLSLVAALAMGYVGASLCHVVKTGEYKEKDNTKNAMYQEAPVLTQEPVVEAAVKVERLPQVEVQPEEVIVRPTEVLVQPTEVVVQPPEVVVQPTEVVAQPAVVQNVQETAPVYEANNNNNYVASPVVVQDDETHPITMEVYNTEVGISYNYLRQYINYDHMQQDLQCLYYLSNLDYIPNEVRQELIDNGIVTRVDFDTQDGIELMANAYNLINMIADFNQSQIRKPENATPESIINVAHLCHDEHDAILVNDMHNNYFYAYKSGRYENAYYTKVFKQLTTLNAAEHEGNASELSVGARWLAQNSIGGGVMQLLRDDMQEDFTMDELYHFFDPQQLNMGQWVINPNLRYGDFNCLTEHEAEVFSFGQLWEFVYTLVNNDLIKELNDFNTLCNPCCK